MVLRWFSCASPSLMTRWRGDADRGASGGFSVGKGEERMLDGGISVRELRVTGEKWGKWEEEEDGGAVVGSFFRRWGDGGGVTSDCMLESEPAGDGAARERLPA
ncbi:hypothetical protein HAX54_017966 [Datura stramonium]|uniref:Uncharacterized protein n=1 Tax=Datura stramonium TaxID=4076 RepID=A0ABS8ULH1_DATST|nr:hypothetical protein [Datura stramonium]